MVRPAPTSPFTRYPPTPTQALSSHPLHAGGPVHADVRRSAPVQQHAAAGRLHRLLPDGTGIRAVLLWYQQIHIQTPPVIVTMIFGLTVVIGFITRQQKQSKAVARVDLHLHTELNHQFDCGVFSSHRPRCDASGHQDGERPGSESVPSADGPQLQPRLHDPSARTDGVLPLPDARSAGDKPRFNLPDEKIYPERF